MIFVLFLLCCLCNASLLHLKAGILQEENVVAQLKAKVLDKGCEGEGNFCGGIAAFPCPQGSTCVDDPRDDCNPLKGGSDCDGICQCNGCEGEGNFCGGVAAFSCPQGSTCVDDPSDNCNPRKGGADCGGLCQCNGGPPTAPTVYPASSTPTAPRSLDVQATELRGSTAARIELVERSSLSIPSSNSILPQSNPSTEALLEKVGADVPSRDRSGSDSAVQASFLAQPPLPPAAVCCDPALEPCHNGNACCFEGHQCCLTGEWSCASGSGTTFTCGGQSTTGPFGSACPPELPPPAVCCSLDTKPGRGGNPACPYSVQCCLSGTWSCTAADGSFTCDGKPATAPAGAPCPLDCTNVYCPTLPCPTWQQYQPADECCPVCQICKNGYTPTSIDCSTGASCGERYKCEGYVVKSPSGSWHSMGLCCIDCSLSFCIDPPCAPWQQYTPAGQCCPQCKTCARGDSPSTVDCALTRGVCNGGYTCEGFIDVAPNGDRTSHGLCCPPDCTKVACPALFCARGYQSWKPAGSCCTLCKRAICPNGSAPVTSTDCSTTGGVCPAGSICQGYVVLSNGSRFSYGLCCTS